jgi:outer membrane protein assembly factor BamE (lipoprotein component of BamABCDE complex)
MYTRISKTLLAVGVTLSLGACASVADLHASTPEYARLGRLHAGLTQEEVRDIAGNPDMVTGDTRPGGAGEWIYDYTTLYGKRDEFDVTFDANGRVSGTHHEEIH